MLNAINSQNDQFYFKFIFLTSYLNTTSNFYKIYLKCITYNWIYNNRQNDFKCFIL